MADHTLLVEPRSVADRLHRISTYVRAMFPPAILAPVGFLQFFSLYFGFQALDRVGAMHVSLRAIIAALSTVLWMLLVRVQDDLADVTHDRRMARLGDPRYQDRPTVTGAMTVTELRTFYRTTAAGMLGMNAMFGASFGLAACSVGFVITWLGFRWFFIPSLAAHPTPAAYLLRKALTILVALYALAIFVDDFGIGIPPIAVLLILAPTAGVAAWEVARKIRIPSDETSYQTYSKAFGWRVAGWLPALFVTLSFACFIPVAHAANIPAVFLIAVGAAASLVIAACLRFQIVPTRRHARLDPFVQIYGATAHGGLVLTLAFQYGVRAL